MKVAAIPTGIDGVPPAGSLPMGSHAARGAMWTLLFSGVTKVMTFGSQIALAWFLVPEEFGLVAMTLAVMSFTAMVGGANLKNLLIRSERFVEDAGQIFWLAAMLNLGAGLLLAVGAPVVGILLDEPRVVGLILVASLAPPLQSLSTVYLASLQRDLRFRRVAMIQCGAAFVQNGSAVMLAWLGFGAVALIAPLAPTAVWTVLAYRLSSGKVPLGKPEPKRWRALARPVFWLMMNALFTGLIVSGASLAIGLAGHDPAVVGFYYWGFTVSSQAVFLLVTNLQGVLFPVLNKLNGDPERQFAAVDKACRTLLGLVTPVCVLQALLAGPCIRLLFHSRWEPSISVVQSISLGLLTQPLYLVAVSLLLARGCYRQLASVTALVAITTTMAAAVGAALGDQTTISRFAGVSLLVSNAVAGLMSYREFGQGKERFLNATVPTLGVVLLPGALGWWMVQATAVGGAAIQIAVTAPAFLLSYFLLGAWFFPEVATRLAARLFRRPTAATMTRNFGIEGRVQSRL